jgi:predicted dehydrogenase
VLVGRRLEATTAKAAKLGIPRAETDYRTVLDDPDIDAVVVASPDDTHERIAIDALAAGKSVLLQKPMAMDSRQCRAIIDTAAAARGTLSVSFMHRYFPEVAWLRQMVAGGRLGKIHGARIRNATPGADWSDWFYRPGKVAGGVVMQLGVHGIDLCRHLFGEIETVKADISVGRPVRELADGTRVRSALEDNAMALYRLADAVGVSHEMSWTELRGCDRFRLELYAENGTVLLRTERGPAAVYAPSVTGKEEWLVPQFPDAPFGQAHHRHWLEVVRGEAPPDGTAQAGLRSVMVAEAVYAAARTGGRIALPPAETPGG